MFYLQQQAVFERGRNFPGLGKRLEYLLEEYYTSMSEGVKIMISQTKELKHKIDRLADHDKLTIANYILENLDTPDPLIDKEWIKESKSRLKAMHSGKMKLFDYKEVMAKHLK